MDAVRVAATGAGLGYYPSFVAAELGFFADENLEVHVDVPGPWRVAQMLRSGDADIVLGGIWRPLMYLDGTLNGNPLGAMAGLATLQELQHPGTYDDLNSKGEYLCRGLTEIARSLKGSVQAMAAGPIVGISFTDGDPTDPDTIVNADRRALKALELALLRRGVYTNLFVSDKLFVSTAHTIEDHDAALSAFGDALEEVCSARPAGASEAPV